MVNQRSGIVTPEAVVLEFQTASVGSRALARGIDLALQAIILSIFAAATALLVGLLGTSAQTVAAVLATVLGFLVFVGYSILFDTLWNGLTPGKALVGLRIVTTEGGPIRFRHAAVRELIGLVELFLLSFIAVFSAVLSVRNQRVGDMAGGTIVLRERAAANVSISVSYPPPPGLDAYVRALDVTTVTGDQYRLIRSFLLRVKQLRPAVRATMAVQLANPIAVGMRHEPPPGIDAEVFLVCVASAYQLRHGGPGAVWSGPGWPGYGLPNGWGFPPGFNGLMPAPPPPAWGAAPPGSAPAPTWAPAGSVPVGVAVGPPPEAQPVPPGSTPWGPPPSS